VEEKAIRDLPVLREKSDAWSHERGRSLEQVPQESETYQDAGNEVTTYRSFKEHS
jgi:hypothetical protein